MNIKHIKLLKKCIYSKNCPNIIIYGTNQIGKKSVLLKNKFDVKRSVSAPLILTERIYDVIGTITIALTAIVFLGLDYLPVIFVAIAITFFVVFSIYSKSSFDYFLRLIKKLRFLKRFHACCSWVYCIKIEQRIEC